jgi:hypothetical protein
MAAFTLHLKIGKIRKGVFLILNLKTGKSDTPKNQFLTFDFGV